MTNSSVDYLPDPPEVRVMPVTMVRTCTRQLRVSRAKVTLTLLGALLFCASVGAHYVQNSLLARHSAADGCSWYTVESGDTLSEIAQHYHITISTLTRVNAIPDENVIFVGRQLCVPGRRTATVGGLTASGGIRWYAYDALGWSSRTQVRHMLYRVANRHRLPSRLLLAIAWQESGWTQHVIAWDGGIGVMQLMPYTAMNINADIGQQLDPYNLEDNLNLGATYLQWLWQDFHGNLPSVISSYNEGGWAVRHLGIYNWSYVHNVLALMHNLS